MKQLDALKVLLKKYRQHISIVLGLIFAGLIVYYIIANYKDFSSLTIVNFWLLGVIFVSVLVRNFSTGLVMDTVLRPLGVHLSLTESFGLANLTRLINQILPGKVGIVMRSVYLKKKHGLSYASFSSSFAASQVVLYLISSLLGIAAFFMVQSENKDLSQWFLYGLVAAVLVLASFLLMPRTFTRNIKHNRINKAIEGWYSIRADRSGLWSLALSSLLFIASSTIIMYSSFNSLGVEISLWMALFFSSINIINALIAITPAGFGISEGIIVLLAVSAGIPVSVGLAAALLQRVITFFAVVIVAPYYSSKLFGLTPLQLLRRRFKKSD